MPPNLTLLLEQTRQIRASGRGIEDVLAFLRQQGCSKVDSIRVLMSLESLALPEAKRLVHASKAWEDTREADEAFHESLIDAVERAERERMAGRQP